MSQWGKMWNYFWYLAVLILSTNSQGSDESAILAVLSQPFSPHIQIKKYEEGSDQN